MSTKQSRCRNYRLVLSLPVVLGILYIRYFQVLPEIPQIQWRRDFQVRQVILDLLEGLEFQRDRGSHEILGIPVAQVRLEIQALLEIR